MPSCRLLEKGEMDLLTYLASSIAPKNQETTQIAAKETYPKVPKPSYACMYTPTLPLNSAKQAHEPKIPVFYIGKFLSNTKTSDQYPSTP